MCSKEVENKRLMSHYTYHCKDEISTKFGDLMEFTTFTCKVCGKRVKNRDGLIVHIGMVHQKVNSVLVAKGYEPVRTRHADKRLEFDFTNPESKLYNEESPEESGDILDKPDILEEKEIEEELLMNAELVESSTQEMDPFQNERDNDSIEVADTNGLDLEEQENEVNHVDTLVKSEEENTPENIIIEMASVVEVMLEETDDNMEVASDDPLNNDVVENIEMDNAKKSTKKVDTCQICTKEVVGHRLLQHYTNHCMQGIKEKFGHLMDLDKLECKLCSTKMKHKSGLTTHMGMVHMKVNDILVERGFEPIQRNPKRIKYTYEVGPNEEKFTEVGPKEEKLTDETEIGPKEEELTDEVEDEPKEEELTDEVEDEPKEEEL